MPAKLPVRPLRHIGGGIVEVELTRGRVALIDEIDAERVSVCNWFLGKYKLDRSEYALGRWLGRVAQPSPKGMHLFLFGKPGFVIDHINHDGLDNRRANIRVVTHQQNMWNSRAVGGTSKFKGVHISRKRWIATAARGKVGSYSSEIEAALAYDAAAIAHFGEFAATNASLGLLPEEAR